MSDKELAPTTKAISEGDLAKRSFKPSEVYIGMPPLTASLKSSENEHAAALFVVALKKREDIWRAIKLSEIGEIIYEMITKKEEPAHSFLTNPFFNPDFRRLVKDGFARFLGDPDIKGCSVEFTTKGIEGMRKWIRA